MLEINSLLDGWSPLPDDYYLYELWAEHKIMPYGGGYLDQPQWWYDLVSRCILHEELIRLNDALPSAANLPKFGDFQ